MQKLGMANRMRLRMRMDSQSQSQAESKLKGESRSIRMEDFLSWGQFFT